MRVLYVTSFSPDLYKSSGKRMLESYAAVGAPERMLVCHEGLPDLKNRYPHDVYDLGTDEFLQTWLEENRDVIPVHLGGDLQPCRCPTRHKRHARHRPGCIQDWMRRNASRWFRKVASWRYAAEQDADIIFWIDSDCIWKKQLPQKELLRYFAGTAVFYFRAHRPAPDTGLLGFDLRKGGREFIDEVCRYYTSKDYRKFDRYDDGYIVGVVINDKIVATHDVIPKKQSTNHVIPLTSIAQYVDHDKGRNGTQLNVMI